MMKLIPNHFAGFDQNANPKAKAIRVGNITYSLSEKSFGSSHQAVKILLFDYKEAPVMYNQAVQHWSSFAPVESDSLIQRSVKMLGLSGWELYNKVNRSSQIFIGVHNRFFLTITSENVVLEVLQKMVDHFKLENFSE